MRSVLKFGASICLVAGLSLACERAELVQGGADNGSEGVEKGKDSPWVQGETIIKLSDDLVSEVEAEWTEGLMVPTKSGNFGVLASELGIKKMERLFPHAGRFEERTRAEGMHRWYKVTYDPSVALTKAQASFEGMAGIEEVEAVPVIKSTSTKFFNDPQYNKQWHYYNDGTLSSKHKKGADINVVTVWDKYTVGREDVIVAVVDGGIDAKHEDLKAHYRGGYNFVTNSSVVTADDHGTHVAGTIGAVNNNGKGVSGIAGGDSKRGIKGVGLLSCQIFDGDNGAAGANPIKWGADNGAVISQNSWGIDYDGDYDAASNDRISGSMKAAIDYFVKYAGMDENNRQEGPMKGGVVIFAAGNDNWDANAISAYDPVVAVSSIAPDFSKAYYSSYGDWVDIAAPGGSVEYSNGTVISTLPDNEYGGMQGTSMACPHVSGVAALIVSHFGGPGFTNDMLKDKLLGGANKKALNPSLKMGPLLDALGAITYGQTEPPKKVSSFSVSSESNNIKLGWSVTSDPDDGTAYGYILLAAKDKELFNGINLNRIPDGIKSAVVETNGLKVGDDTTGVIIDLDFDSDYYVALAAFDYGRNYSSLSSIKSISTESNEAPRISTDYDGNYRIKAHEVLNIAYDIVDAVGHGVKVTMSPGSDAVEASYNPFGQYVLTFTGNKEEPGKYTAVITAKDKYGAATNYSVDYEIMENRAPVVLKQMENMVYSTPGERFSFDMSEYIDDPDGETPRYFITISDKTVLHINPIGNILHATILSYGKVDVSIKAIDSRELEGVLEFKVLVQDPEKAELVLYPNPVVDVLNVNTGGEEVDAEVAIYTSSGSFVKKASVKSSAFDHAPIDMKGLAPGRYVVEVKHSGHTYTKTIVKL